MPDLDTYKRILSLQGGNANRFYKSHSDMVMETTWDSDIQSKICYIYDYFHDDSPALSKNMTYENTTKTKIDAKFIITQYGSLSKDQVEYHIMFKPSQKVTFCSGDELYYYETDYVNKYGVQFPIGMFIDIPDDKDIYHKWLICSKEIGNQFIKYSVLPCDYHLCWIENNSGFSVKRNMWCVSRAMNSYTTGLWIDRYFNALDDVNKLWLPLNSITEKIYYTNNNDTNQRFIVSALIEKPLTWKVSKIENTKPLGIVKVTLDQDSFNSHTDYVNFETGEMYADYYSNIIKADNSISESAEDKTFICRITSASNTIKCGGSYKLLTASFFDCCDNDVTNSFIGLITKDSWECFIDGKAFNTGGLITLKPQNDKNKIRIKLANDKSFLTKTLTVRCTVNKYGDEISGEISFDIISL